MKIIKETPEYVLINWHYPEPIQKYRNTASKEKKFLCFGGPFHGLRKASCQVGETYRAYNSGCSRKWQRLPGGSYRKTNTHTQVWIHESALP